MKNDSASPVVSPELERIGKIPPDGEEASSTGPAERATNIHPSWLNEFHRINIERQHEAFAPAHSLFALIACCMEELGEMAGATLGITGEKKRKAHLTKDDLLDGVADTITYLSLVAGNVGCSDLQGLLGKTFNMVSERAGSKLRVPTPESSRESESAAGVPAEGKTNRKKGDEPCPEVLKPDVSNSAPTSDPKGAAHIGGEPQLVDGLKREGKGESSD